MIIKDINEIAQIFHRAPSRTYLDKSIDIQSSEQKYFYIDGSFSFVYESVVAGHITLILDGDKVLGISFCSSKNNHENIIVEALFEKRYKYKPWWSYIYTAFGLVAAGVEVADIIEDENYTPLIILPRERKIIDTFGNIIAEADPNIIFMEDVKDNLYGILETIQKNTKKYTERVEDDSECSLIHDAVCENCAEYSEGRCRYETLNKLPSTLQISYAELEGYERTVRGVKNFLRDTFGHYLAGKNYAGPIMRSDDGEEVVLVKDIHWGRPIGKR